MKQLSLFFLMFFLLSSATAYADKEKDLLGKLLNKNDDDDELKQPDIPGILYLSIGWSIFNDRPQNMNNNIWGSRAFQAYYMYDFPLGKDSRFAIRPGFGISSTKFKFTTNDNPGFTATLTMLGDEQTIVTPLVADPRFQNITNLRKSQLELVFLDIPIEFILNSKNEMERNGFYLALGIRGGLRIDSKTKVVYWQDGERRKSKQNGRFNLNNTRLSVGGRTGVGNVSLFYWWTFTDMFKDGKGPVGTDGMNYMTFGLSMSIL